MIREDRFAPVPQAVDRFRVRIEQQLRRVAPLAVARAPTDRGRGSHTAGRAGRSGGSRASRARWTPGDRRASRLPRRRTDRVRRVRPTRKTRKNWCRRHRTSRRAGMACLARSAFTLRLDTVRGVRGRAGTRDTPWAGARAQGIRSILMPGGTHAIANPESLIPNPASVDTRAAGLYANENVPRASSRPPSPFLLRRAGRAARELTRTSIKQQLSKPRWTPVQRGFFMCAETETIWTSRNWTD